MGICMKSSSAIAISFEQSSTIITAGVLVASVAAYVIPIYGLGQSVQSTIAEGQTTGTVCQDQEACIPSAKTCMAVLFLGLHACGLLSNSYISKLFKATRFVVKALLPCLVLDRIYMPRIEWCAFTILRLTLFEILN